jgi:hypothetical protein
VLASTTVPLVDERDEMIRADDDDDGSKNKRRVVQAGTPHSPRSQDSNARLRGAMIASHDADSYGR